MSGISGNITTLTEDIRPCTVGARKAIFHKWVNIELVIFKPNGIINEQRLDHALELYRTKRVVEQYFDIDKINVVGALIEFEDGTVKEVEASHVKFLDSEKLFILGYRGDYDVGLL